MVGRECGCKGKYKSVGIAEAVRWCRKGLKEETLQGALNSRVVASKQKFQALKQTEGGGKEYRTTSICDFLRLLRNILMHHTPGVGEVWGEGEALCPLLWWYAFGSA